MVTAALALAGLTVVLGQTRAEDDQRGIQAAIDAYTAAFNKRDLDGLLAYFVADADYLDQSGKEHKGKVDLAEFFKQSLVDLKDQKLKTTIVVRLLPESQLSAELLAALRAELSREAPQTG
jgi:uncharacterized protein (TIGR02246 family)